MLRPFLSITAIASVLVTSSCGGDKKDTPAAARAPQASPAPGETNLSGQSVKFECNRDQCDSGSQYCLASKILGNETLFLTSECRALPNNCRTRECIEKDALTQFENSNNCANGQTFSNRNGSITFTCLGPGLSRPIF
jgi:hypothetical protein